MGAVGQVRWFALGSKRRCDRRRSSVPCRVSRICRTRLARCTIATAADLRTERIDHSKALARELKVIVYVYRGSIDIATVPLAQRHGAILGQGDSLEMNALEASGVLVLAGRPLREPVAQAGPFVMNTRAELEQAFEDYRAGRFQAEPIVSVQDACAAKRV